MVSVKSIKKPGEKESRASTYYDFLVHRITAGRVYQK